MGPFSKIRKERKRAGLGRIYQFCLGSFQFEKEIVSSCIAYLELHKSSGTNYMRKVGPGP